MWRLLLVILLVVSTASAEEEPAPAPVPPLETKAELTGHRGWVRTLAFDPATTRLASGGPDRTLRIWSVADEKQLAIYTIPAAGEAREWPRSPSVRRVNV